MVSICADGAEVTYYVGTKGAEEASLVHIPHVAAAFPKPDLCVRLARRLVHLSARVLAGINCPRGGESGYAVEGGCKWREAELWGIFLWCSVGWAIWLAQG